MSFSYYHNGNGSDDRKMSGFSKRVRTAQAEESALSENNRNTKGSGKVTQGARARKWWVTLLVDLVLLAVLAGLVVGCIYGYRALRDLYAPVWENREVVFQVKMEGINPDMVKYGSDGRPKLVNEALWSSDHTDADMLGVVTDVRTVLESEADGINTLTLYLTVEAKAYYREGKGYRMGETMLLAGSEGVYRLQGMTAQGLIISMHEKKDETTEAVETSPVEEIPDNVIDPDAQG